MRSSRFYTLQIPRWTWIVAGLVCFTFWVAWMVPVSTASGPVPVAFGTSETAQINTAGGVQRFSFSATVGQRLFVMPTAQSNGASLDWHVEDAYGRVVVSDVGAFGALGPLGPVALMGGSYELVVEAQPGTTGTVEFGLDEPDDSTTSIGLGQVVSGDIGTPGEIDTFTLELAAGTRFLFDLQAASAPNDVGLAITDALGFEQQPLTSRLQDSGPFTVPDGLTTLELRSERGGQSSYTFELIELSDTVASTVGVDTNITTVVGAAETVSVPIVVPSQGTYGLELVSVVNGNQLNWRLDGLGLTIFDFTSSLADREPVTLGAGQYTLTFRGERAESGSAVWRLNTVTETTQPISYNTATTATLSAPGDRRNFTFTAAAGDVVAIDVQAGTNLSTLEWSITDGAGRDLSNGSRYDVALEAGDYTLTMAARTGVVGSATFALVPKVVTTSPMTVGGPAQSGVIDTVGETLRYAFTAATGELVDISFTNTTNGNSLNYRLLDGLGREVIARTGSLVSQSGVPLVGGAYILEVLPQGSASGSFDLRLSSAGTSSYTPGGTPITLATEVSGSVSSASAPVAYTFTLSGPTTVYADLLQGNVQLDWALLDPVGEPLFEGVAAGAGSDRGPFALQPGTYTLVFTTSNPASRDYGFVVYDVPPSTLAPFSMGDTVTGSLAVPGERHAYSLTVATSTSVLFEYVAGGSQLEWWMIDAVGNEVVPETQALLGGGRRYAIGAGTYTLYVRTRDGSPSTYAFDVHEPTDIEVLAPIGQRIEGEILTPGSTVTYRFDLPNQVRRAVLDMIDGDADLFWELFDPYGRSVFGSRQAPFDSSDVGPLALPAGSYRLVIEPRGANLIDWRFALTSSVEASLPGEVDAYLEHEFEIPKETLVWKFELTEPRRLYFDVQTIGSIFHRFDVTVTHEPSGFVAYSADGINTVTADAGPLVLAPGIVSVRVQHQGTQPNTFGFVLGSVLDDTRGELRRNWVVEAGVQTPGGTVAYTVTADAPTEPLTFDVMRGSANARWTLLDPVGTPVFDAAEMARATQDDQGPFYLAEGAYSLILDPVRDDITDVMFRLSSPADLPPATPLAGCPNCDELDVVFVFDTSVSMNNEADEMCDLADDFVASLRSEGIQVTTAYWGITDLQGNPCATSTVVAELGAAVPGDPPPDLAEVGACRAGGQAAEDWALASAVLADRYPWREGAVRLVVPVTDEGPACGGREIDCGIGGCVISLNQADTDAVEFASQIVSLRNVVVSPFLTAADVDEPTVAYAERMAQETGGVMTAATFEPEDLVPTVTAVAGAACNTQPVPIEPVIDQLSPPSGATLPAGQRFVIGGHVLPANLLRPLESVRVDGVAVDALDGAGAFFHEVTLQPGPNTFVIELDQSCGTTSIEVVYEGADPSGAAVSAYADVTAQIDDTFTLTTFRRSDQRLLGRVEAHNQGAAVPGPLLFVIGDDLDGTVTPLGTAGALPTGEPYYEVVPKGQTLAHDATSVPRELVFDNPKRANVIFERRWLAPLNQAPVFASIPPTRVSPGATYQYLPAVTDPNGDPVTISLEMAPGGMVLRNSTISWTPAPGIEGTFDVLVRASDGVGGVADQRYVVTVGSPPLNAPPLFTTAPITQIDSGTDYAYDAQAIDVDGDPITFSLPTAPGGMSVNGAGQVRWSNPADGDYLVGLQAADGQGNAAAQAFTLTVGPSAGDTQAPVITSLPGLLAVVDVPYTYAAMATDADGDPLTWSLAGAPASMTVDPGTGLVSFTPSSAQLGAQPVTLVVSDGQGGQAEQPWTLDVRATPPNGTPYFVSTPVREVAASSPYTYAAQVVDPELQPLAYSLVTAPVGMLISTEGVVTWTAPPITSGPFDVRIRAVDAEGAVAEQAFAISVSGGLPPSDGVAFITVTSPEDGRRVAVPTSIVATVDISDGATVASWEVPGIASGTGPLPAVLGTFDPTIVENGLHDIEVRIVDSYGRTASDSISVVVDGGMKLGSYDVAFMDAEWTSALFSAELLRTYTTLRKEEVGVFGHGWDLGMGDIEVFTNGPLGDGGWRQEGCGGGLVFATICAVSDRPHVVVVRWPDGQVDVFDLAPAPGTTFFAPLVPIAYEARPGTDSTLLPVVGEDSALIIGDSLRASFGATLYDPKQFWLTDNRGNQYLLDVDDGLIQTIDRNGNAVKYGPDGIVPDRGKGVTFQRDAEGRIAKMVLPRGEIAYRYDMAGDLVEVRDQLGAITTFTYDGAHRLVSYGDQGKPPVAVITYDAEGRVAERRDAEGVFVTQSHDTSAWTTTRVGPDPALTTTSYFDADGQIVRIVEEANGEQRVRTAEYTDFRPTRVVGVAGDVSTFVYDDQGRVTRSVDADGVQTDYVYNAFGSVRAQYVNGTLIWSKVFDARGNPIEHRGAAGELLSSTTYDSWGAPIRQEDADRVVSELSYDSQGQLDGVTRGAVSAGPSGGSGSSATTRTVRYALGPDGEILGDASGVPRVEVNDRGQMISYTDENYHVQRWEYNDVGQLSATVDKLGNRNVFEFNDANQFVKETTRLGVDIHFTYDDSGRLVEITSSDTWVRYTYNAWGELLSVENENARTQITRDSRGYPTSETTTGTGLSGLGPHLVEFDFADSGRAAEVRTPFGSTRFTYDADGGPLELIDSNAGTYRYVWRDDGYLDTVTAPDGTIASYGYSSANRLAAIEVESPTGLPLQSLTLGHDRLGRVSERTDHDGLHTYTYADGDRLASVDHPPGSPIADESYAYDALGNRTAWAGHPAPDVVHDAGDRLVADADFLYAYDAEGRLVSKTERVTAVVTYYDWNSLDELIRIREPGRVVEFAYDGFGRRIQVDDNGQITRFVYDGLAPIATLDGSDNLLVWNVQDPWGDLLAEWTPTATRHALHDQLWSRTGVRDAVGPSWDDRDSFGNPPSLSSATALQALTWHSQDRTGLVYMEERYMDPRVGRFISEDTWATGDLYSYALNDPMNVWDPFGDTAAIEYKGLNNTSNAARPGATAAGVRVRCILFTAASGIALGAVVGGVDTLDVVVDVAECVVRGGRGGFCFPADTEVATPQGTVAIQDLEVGDRVIARADDGTEWLTIVPGDVRAGGDL